MTADILAIMPLLIVGIGSLVLLLIEVFLGNRLCRSALAIGIVGLATASQISLLTLYASSHQAFSGLIFVDSYTCFFNLLILCASLLAIFIGRHRLESEGVESPAEFYSLLLMATSGAMIFVAASEMITLFVGLELMSLAAYCLAGSAIGIRSSGESALKYFLLGSFASAFMLYGISFSYGLTGTTQIIGIRDAIAGQGLAGNPLLAVALAMFLIGFGFKIALAPFHLWTADVYQGSPTSVTAYMASVVKAAGIGAMLRVIWLIFGSTQMMGYWVSAIWVIALLTMTIGNLCALRQRSVKRMLAFSSVAHAGYMIVAFLVPGAQGGSAILYYMTAYSLMTLGSFGIVLAVTGQFSKDRHPDDVTRFNGLGQSKPFLAALMAIFMFGLAGLPPGVSGLVGKFYLFNAAIQQGYIWLPLIGVINSAISCYYYLRVMVAMYFVENESATNSECSLALTTAVSLCGIGTIFLGLFPNWLYGIAEQAMRSMLELA